MARAGILYSQVASTANKLAAQGRNPTVDNVREALGNTGSKSTLAPLLKRWKNEQEGLVSEAQSGLPVELVAAVKHLYEQVQYEAQQQVEALRTEMAESTAKFEALLVEETQRADTQQQHAKDLQATLSQKESLLEAVTTANNSAQVTIARLEADASGLQLRLADRQEEIKGLQEQLQQTRTQFAHYQEASATRRDEERRHFEQVRITLDMELSDARQHIAARDNALSSQTQQITTLQSRIAQLDTIEAKHQQLQETHAKLSQHLNTQTALAVDLSNRHDVATDALLEAQKELAILRNERPQLLSSANTLESKVAAQRKELEALRIDQARLEQQLLLAAQEKQAE